MPTFHRRQGFDERVLVLAITLELCSQSRVIGDELQNVAILLAVGQTDQIGELVFDGDVIVRLEANVASAVGAHVFVHLLGILAEQLGRLRVDRLAVVRAEHELVQAFLLGIVQLGARLLVLLRIAADLLRLRTVPRPAIALTTTVQLDSGQVQLVRLPDGEAVALSNFNRLLYFLLACFRRVLFDIFRCL